VNGGGTGKKEDASQWEGIQVRKILLASRASRTAILKELLLDAGADPSRRKGGEHLSRKVFAARALPFEAPFNGKYQLRGGGGWPSSCSIGPVRKLHHSVKRPSLHEEQE